MPSLGQVVRARDVGLASGYHKVIWAACTDCGVERWVLFRSGRPQSERCHPCGARAGADKRRGKQLGPRAGNWRGGRQVMKNGYVVVTLPPDDPYVPMSSLKKHRAVYEHRLVMARHLGRCLASDEHVHHVNGNKTDNRLENLELVRQSDHARWHRQELVRLRRRVAELEQQIADLKAGRHEASPP